MNASVSYNILHSFADISQFSSITDKEEILFFSGAVFRIDSVEQENDSKWIIKLALKNETVEQIKQIMNGFEMQLTFATRSHALSTKTDDYKLFNKYHQLLTNKKFSANDILIFMRYINFDYVINNSGNYEKAMEYYKKFLLDKNFNYHPKFIVLNIIIGNNYSRLSQCYDALLHYAIAFSLLDDNNRLTAELYNHIGDVWKTMDNIKNALLCLYIYLKENNYEDAIFYEKQANEFDEDYGQISWLDYETLFKDYQNQLNNKFDRPLLERACMQYSNGLRFIKEGDYYPALQNLLQAKQLFTDHLPLYRCVIHKFAKLYENIAFAYLCLSDHFNALMTWKRAIDIRTSFAFKLVFISLKYVYLREEILGGAMGSAFTLTLTNIFMWEWKKELVRRQLASNEIYARYVSCRQLGTTVSFLNVFIENENGVLASSVYRKEAVEPYIVPFNFYHPRHVFTNIIDGTLMHAMRYSSTLSASMKNDVQLN